MKKLFTAILSLMFVFTMAGMAAALDANIEEDEVDYATYDKHAKNDRFYVPYKSGTFTIYREDNVHFYNEGGHGTDAWWYDNGSCFSSGYMDNAADRRFNTAGTRTIQFKKYQNLWSPEEDWDTKYVRVLDKLNTYPVVLVHGFAGWGRDELNWDLGIANVNLYYWGGQAFGAGEVDVEKTLNNRGCKVFTASVGPVTSVYDRACDLWAQLKGGNGNKALYGANHAAAASTTASAHAADSGSRTYNNLTNTASQTLGAVNAGNPVHLIGHSMGGLTIRMLAGLLEEGSPWGDTSIWPGNQNGYIRSITTAATPHNGTTLTHFVQTFTNLMDNVMIDWLEILTGETITNPIDGIIGYGLDVEQWSPGIDGQGSSLDNQTDVGPNCVTNAKPDLWDLSLWDMSPCGAMYDLNTWPQMQASSDIYYFSYSCMQSGSDGSNGSGNSLGTVMYCAWKDCAAYPDYVGDLGLSSNWRYHDGVISTIGAPKPSCDEFTDTTESSDAAYSVYGPKGKWYHIDMLHEDHMDVVGGILGIGLETLTTHDPWDQPGHDHYMTDSLGMSSWGTGTANQIKGKIHGEHCTWNEPTIYDFWEMHVERLERLPTF